MNQELLDRSGLIKKIKQAAYLEGSFITRAGKETNYYIDKYRFETDPSILYSLSYHLAKKIENLDFDKIAAPELGAVPLATATALWLKKPFLIVRKQSKGYGTENLIEGSFNEGESVVVIEDVITTGGAVSKACAVLKSNSLKIVSVIGVINREEGGLEALEAEGFPSSGLITTSDLRSI